MKPKQLTDEMIIDGEIEALENAINNPRDRDDYSCDFWSNADVLLRAMKALKKGTVQDGQREIKRAS